MELSAGSLVRWTAAPRMIPSRYPVAGLLDRVAAPADLDALFELEGWTNDRISNELGLLHTIPESEWVTGTPMARVVMAAFCHPHPGGGRFSTEERGAWYAAGRWRPRSRSRCITGRRSCERWADSRRAWRCECISQTSRQVPRCSATEPRVAAVLRS